MVGTSLLPVLSTYYETLSPGYLASSHLMPLMVDHGPILQKSKPKLGEAPKFVQHPTTAKWLN